MRILPIIIVGLVFASAAFLVQPVQAQPISSISGQVCTQVAWDPEECYEGLIGATVTLKGGPLGLPVVDQTATTDEWGQFSFPTVADGDYKLTVSRTGFVATSLDIKAPSNPLKIQLKPQEIVVEGTVTDAKGAVVKDARVSFWGNDYAYASTDASGKYTASLLAGQYHMEVDGGRSGYVQQEVFVDGTRIDVELGALPGQDAVLKGRAVDQDGNPVVGADVVVDQWERETAEGYQYGNYRNWTTTDSQGRYEVDVYAGSMSISFRKEGYAEVYDWIEVASGKSKTLDVEMAKYPEKTARLVGKVTDAAGNGLTHISVSIQHPEYGLYSCSIDNRYARGEPEPMYAESYPSESYGDDGDYEERYYDEGMAYSSYYYQPDCDITVHEDGTFTGNVTPGYSIISVWYDHWASCTENGSSNGDYHRDCGPNYFGYTQTLQLQPDADNPLTIKLRERPGSDATVSGYAINGETDTAVKNAYISFNNEETYAWGNAETDKDGSYKIRVRSGYHQVSVWADGFLPWQGVVYIPKGADMPFDVVLTPGEARYGGCCYGPYMYAEDDMAYAHAAPAEARMGAGMSSMGFNGGSSGEGYEDLGGGLGPYDAASRNAQTHSGAGKQSPVPLAFAIVALGLVALRRRN